MLTKLQFLGFLSVFCNKILCARLVSPTSVTCLGHRNLLDTNILTKLGNLYKLLTSPLYSVSYFSLKSLLRKTKHFPDQFVFRRFNLCYAVKETRFHTHKEEEENKFSCYIIVIKEMK